MPRASSWGFMARVSFPSKNTRPRAGAPPVTALIRVDFPAPLGPTIMSHSPGARSKETPFKMVRSP